MREFTNGRKSHGRGNANVNSIVLFLLLSVRTLTTAYKRRKDTDNIKRVKRKGMYLEIHDCNESLREMKCLVINLKRTGQEKKPNGKRVVE